MCFLPVGRVLLVELRALVLHDARLGQAGPDVRVWLVHLMPQ